MKSANSVPSYSTGQCHGYNALSFRDVAAAIGVKSSSIHYHFPTKGDLAAALERRYTETGAAYLGELRASSADIPSLIVSFADIFRAALANDNRMCLVGIMAAEHGDLPPEVRAEVARFGDVCIDWLTDILSARRQTGMAMPFEAAPARSLPPSRVRNSWRADVAIWRIAALRTNGLMP